MRKREDILKELEAVKADAARTAQFGSAPQLAMQAGINAPLMSTALGSLLEVALDIRAQVQQCRAELGSTHQLAAENTRLLGMVENMAEHSVTDLASREYDAEDIPVIEPSNVVNTEHLKKIFPPCPKCGSENTNGVLTDETGRSRACVDCGHEWKLEEAGEAAEREVEQICGKCGAVLDEYTTGLFCPNCDEQRGRKKIRRGNS